MPKTIDAIRVRATAREGGPEKRNPRETFWAPLRHSEKFQSLEFPQQISSLEATLCQEFGRELRSALLRQLREGLHILDDDFHLRGLRDFERLFLRYMDFPKDDALRYPFAEALTRYIEHRQEMFRENTALRRIQEQIVAAAGIFFSTRISGYASLVFDLSVGSFNQLAKAFDGNFETFRVFLDAYVPVAFGEVFDPKFAASLDFTMSIPSSVEQAFEVAAMAPVVSVPQATAAATTVHPAAAASVSAARERAEWIWRFANGSLVVPFVVAIGVMFYGLYLLYDLQNIQRETLQPILQHQLELLREDRLRMGNPVPQNPPPPATKTPVAPTTTP